MKSTIKQLGRVTFPPFTGERVYMTPFPSPSVVPNHLARWQLTVDCMLKDIPMNIVTEVFIMIDQGKVKAGHTHRREGPHIDGEWIPPLNENGEPIIMPSKTGLWSYGPWNFPVESPSTQLQHIILASDVSACCAYRGSVQGKPKEGGDCSHLNLSHMKRVRLKAGFAYKGNSTMIHESIPVRKDCERTVVRLHIGYIKREAAVETMK